MAALGLGLVALVVTGATGLSIYPFTCATLPSENWDDHIASRIRQPPLHQCHNVMVLPAHKLAICAIEKVASEHFAGLFNQLNGIPNETAWLSNMPHQTVTWSSVSRGNGWKFALFSSDPLERYLSAFMSKCVPKPVPVMCGVDCCGHTRSRPVSTEEMVSLFEERAQFDAKHGLPGNGHWMSQNSILATRCDLPRVNWFDADYVGHITRDTMAVNEQVQEMFHRLTSVKNIPRMVAPHFPPTSSFLQCPHQHCTAASEQFHLFYRNNSTVRAVMELMADDYENHKKLHFAPPPTRQQGGRR